MINIGDTVKLLGTEDTYEVKAIDPNFEGRGLAVAIWLSATESLEWISATLVQPVLSRPMVVCSECDKLLTPETTFDKHIREMVFNIHKGSNP